VAETTQNRARGLTGIVTPHPGIPYTLYEFRPVQKVYVADSLVDGRLLIDYLNAAGISAELFHQNAMGGLGDLPVTYPEVWIKRDLDIDRAVDLVNQFVSRPTPVGIRLCSQCGESNPENFDICWLCSTPFPAAAS